MKKTIIVTGIFAALYSPAFSQLQKTTSYPAYDNVHQEHAVFKHTFPVYTKYALLTNSDENTPSYRLHFSGDIMNLQLYKIQPGTQITYTDVPFKKQYFQFNSFSPVPTAPIIKL